MGANPARGMDIRLRLSVPVLSSIGRRLAMGRYLIKGVLPNVHDVKQKSSGLMLSRMYDLAHKPIAAGFCYFVL